MASFFSRSLRALQTDGSHRSILGLLSAFVLMSFWAAWFFLAEVSLYEVTSAAWLEVDRVAHEGRQLGTILPPGRFKIVADFPPSAALGHIRPGQPARLRLDGLPWIQYGSISATVASVVGQAKDGHVRAELTIHAGLTSPIPLQQGLRGALEVEVGCTTPALLVLRAAGKLLTKPTEISGESRGISRLGEIDGR